MRKIISFIKKNSWIELVVMFFVAFITNYKFLEFNFDEVWSYGFSLNVAKGMIPYRDFNMIITPLFPLIHGVILFFLGKSIYIFHLVNSLIFTLAFYLLKKLFPQSYYLLIGFIIVISMDYAAAICTYNFLAFALLLWVIYLEEKREKKYDFIIGILIGLIILTKQNIGFLTFIPSLFIIKEFKRFFTRIFGIIVPLFLILIYLITNKALYEFIDYTILGLIDFNSNFLISTHIIVFIFIILFCLYEIFKKKNKSMMIKYLFFFNLMAYPIFDITHIFLPFIITLGCILNKLSLDKKTTIYAFYIFFIMFSFYKIFISDIVYIDNNYVNGKAMRTEEVKHYFDMISFKLKEYEENYDIYIFDRCAYLFKVYSNIDLNKFDLINNGNMGYHGATRYIQDFSESCTLRKCLFIIESTDEIGQTNENIVNYVKENYKYKEKLYNYSIYTNDFKIKN